MTLELHNSIPKDPFTKQLWGILVHKLQRMLKGFKIAQLNSERPFHQTAVRQWCTYLSRCTFSHRER